MTQSSSTSGAQPFAFQIEFTPSGDVLGGPDKKYFSREETDQLAASARAEGEARAKMAAEVRGFASVDRIVAHLSPVAAQLTQLADQLRREAAELALVAAKKIAGQALDAEGTVVATTAISEAIRLLKNNPVVTVCVAAESMAEVERRMEQIRRTGQGANIAFVADPSAKPGDWSITWGEGSTGFSRADVEATIDSIVNARLADPVEPQLELFSAA